MVAIRIIVHEIQRNINQHFRVYRHVVMESGAGALDLS